MAGSVMGVGEPAHGPEDVGAANRVAAPRRPAVRVVGRRT